MRFCKTLAIVAIAALAMVGTKSAKADGSDPKVKIVVPTDPTIEPCSEVPEGVSCFTSNSESNPVTVTGPTLAQLESPEGADIMTDFIYEPTDCVGGVCPSSDTLQSLWIAITPTLAGAAYNCELGGTGGETPAFNQCPAMEGVSSGGLLLLELACVSTQSNPCSGMLPGEEGSAEVTPEPGELALLGVGIAFVGLCGWKRRQAVELSRTSQQNLAIC
jgi:hypothetical protein